MAYGALNSLRHATCGCNCMCATGMFLRRLSLLQLLIMTASIIASLVILCLMGGLNINYKIGLDVHPSQRTIEWNKSQGDPNTVTKIPLSISSSRSQNDSTATKIPLNISSSRSQNDNRRRGYILTLDYTGQQSAGIRGLLSQQCWVASFDLPLQIVEPFGSDSRLVHSANLWEAAEMGQQRQVRFEEYFNLEHFNRVSEQASKPPLIPWEQFVQSAPRKIIVLTIGTIHHKECLNYKEDMCSRTQRHNLTALEAFTSGCNSSEKMNKAVEFLQSKHFEIVKTVCLNCQNGMPSDLYMTPRKVNEHIFGTLQPAEVTLLINQWRFSLSITAECKESPRCQKGALTEAILPSSVLQTDADMYINSIMQAKHSKTVALMIRLEWYLITHGGNTRQTVNECLKRVRDLLTKLKEENSSVEILLALDVGKYGSSTLSKHNLKQEYLDTLVDDMKSLVHTLYSGRWQFEDWEDSFSQVTGGLDDRGYIAALQSTIASKANHLILMGGGSFQKLALIHYIKNHPIASDRSIHYVCVAVHWEKDFTSLYSDRQKQ